MNEQVMNEIGSGSTRKPTPITEPTTYFAAIKYAEEAIAAGVDPKEIQEKLLALYTPLARDEYSTRRHQMTLVSVIIGTENAKQVKALQAEVAALKEQIQVLVGSKPKLRDQLKKPRKSAKKSKAKKASRKTFY